MLNWPQLGLIIVSILLAPSIVAQQTETQAGSLERRYAVGAVSHYLMRGNNDGREYSIQATDVVKRDAISGRYYEEISWSDFASSTQQSLSPASLALRQTISLDAPASYMKMPNLAVVQPLMIGPITDTLTFYSDLLLAVRAKLVQPGQTAYVPRTTPNSWADGHYVLVGEDVVDLSIKVGSVNSAEHSQTLLIQHVPPPALHIQLPAHWMQESETATPNNFVQA